MSESRKYEQRVRADAAEATRRRILDAVERLIQAAPTQPVSLDQVARQAEVSRSTIYLAFGSRQGLFDALTRDLWDRSGFDAVIQAVQHPDAREHLRRGLRAGVQAFAAQRDVYRRLFGAALLDPEAVGGAVTRIEHSRWGGMTYLADRLAEQGQLRPDVTVEDATRLLWLVAGFEAFDTLYTGRGMSADEVADLLVAVAERTLCR